MSSRVLGILGHSCPPPGCCGDTRGSLEPMDARALPQKGAQLCCQGNLALGWSLSQLEESGPLCVFAWCTCVCACVHGHGYECGHMCMSVGLDVCKWHACACT